MKIQANGIQIEVADQGPRDGPVVLLIMGLGMQLIAWPQALVQLLIDRGFRVVRFDNRDIGLSQGFDHAGVPNMALASLRYALHLPVKSPYSLADMGRDALGVLDALGIAQAHVCGASMGGMIAQHLAAEAPQRVASLTLMMTTSGARSLPQPPWSVRKVLMSSDALITDIEMTELGELWVAFRGPTEADPAPPGLRIFQIGAARAIDDAEVTEPDKPIALGQAPFTLAFIN